MKSNYCIYKHTSPNGKVYIGQTCKKPNERWSNGYGYKKQQFFYRAIKKYGWDNFKHEILFEGLSKEEADKKEIELINKYNSTNSDFGYNISLGGGGTLGVKHSDETKQKISNAKIGQKRSEESKIKQSQTMKGHIHSDETRIKIGNANSKRIWTDESRQKLSKHFKGKHITEEHKKKISNFQKLHSPNKKQIICIETNIIYDSASEAERKTGINRRNISFVCSGKRQTAGGYHWQFFNSDANLNR